MTTGTEPSGAAGLERSRGGWMHGTAPHGGVELLRARFTGRPYARHRHDTYAICMTDLGVQLFDYRGATRTSMPGQVVVLHPDEFHDGRAGSDEGFAYRIIYVAPGKVADAVRALCGRPVPLPFAREAVSANATLAAAIADAFQEFPAAMEPLALDALIEGLARGLIEADPSAARTAPGRSCDTGALDRARQLLDANRTRVVTSSELEAASGHSRYALARQFRQVYGTSPYRYLLMRRLDLVRAEIRAGKPLAEISAGCGFADQAHMTRAFGAAYGLSPARYRAASRGRTASQAATTGSGRPTRQGWLP
jgi:AraC-like DNA-binding protein